MIYIIINLIVVTVAGLIERRVAVPGR